MQSGYAGCMYIYARHVIYNTRAHRVYRMRRRKHYREVSGADTAEVSAGPLGGFKDILRLALAISENYFVRETQEKGSSRVAALGRVRRAFLNKQNK